MKLYTEEQVREALNAGFRLAMETDGGLNDYKELFINALIPIELPSNEEIKQQAEKYAISETPDLNTDYARNIFEGQKDGFEQGLKFMRDKIQGGNK